MEPVLAVTGSQAVWYATRGTGLVALLLLTGSVLLGVVETTGWARPSWPRFLTAGLHRNLSLLATAFVAVHIAAAVTDGFAPIGWLDAIVPFHSPYRTFWLGLGTVAFDLLLAVVITSLVRRRLGLRAWRVVHWSSYACWPVALVHGFGTGTDTPSNWVLDLSLACLAAVVLAVWWRLWKAERGPAAYAPVRTAAVVTSVVLPIVVVVWLFAGPLKPGWAARAGTPKSDIGTTVTTNP